MREKYHWQKELRHTLAFWLAKKQSLHSIICDALSSFELFAVTMGCRFRNNDAQHCIMIGNHLNCYWNHLNAQRKTLSLFVHKWKLVSVFASIRTPESAGYEWTHTWLPLGTMMFWCGGFSFVICFMRRAFPSLVKIRWPSEFKAYATLIYSERIERTIV